MNNKDILETILRNEGISYNALAKSIHVKTQVLYDIKNGKVKTITNKMAEKILSVYPHYNRIWLLTGKGDIISTPTNEQTINGNGNAAIVGGNKNSLSMAENSDINKALNKAINEITEQRKLVMKSQEQIDRLLSLLEKRG